MDLTSLHRKDFRDNTHPPPNPYELQGNALVFNRRVIHSKTNAFLYHLNPNEHIIPAHPPTQILTV